MRKAVITFALTVLALLSSKAETPSALKVTSYKLNNGLTVWLNEDHSAPAAYGAIVVNAGARDCPGTGIAHYFEHIMFKGTDKIGTINYAAEKPYLDSIAIMYDSLAVAPDDATRATIQKEINRLNIAGSRYAIPNEFTTLSNIVGSSGLNAFTNQDETVYHSVFLPQYFEQWAELNSERLIAPVFRLFQSELETVYEEKNMYADNMIRTSIEKMSEYCFKGTPYAESVIGTASSLKSPSLSLMADFFSTYYVANNMCLILTGNFDSETVKPVIERTFGRIKKSESVKRSEIIYPDLRGRTEQDIIVNIPLIQMEAYFYKAPAFMKKGYWEMRLLSRLLSNSECTGFLDKLSYDHKLTMASAECYTFAEAGGYLIFFVPKIVGQSIQNAEELINGVIGQLKVGDFDEKFFESCKLSLIRGITKELEDISDRGYMMAKVFNAGYIWEDYTEALEKVRAVSKDDIVRAANRIFTDDRIIFRKKKGTPEKVNLKKPPYDHVTAESKDSTSRYAESLKSSVEKIEKKVPVFDTIKEVDQVHIAPLVRLYAAPNPVNNIFTLEIRFLRGKVEEPSLTRLASYMNMLGTKDCSYDELFRNLQELGGTAYFGVAEDAFSFTVSGYDDKFEETLALASTLLKDIEGDNKKLKKVIEDERTETKLNRKDIATLVRSIYAKAAYGNKSPYLVDRGKANSDYLLGLWHDLQKVQCDILYTGNCDSEAVCRAIRDCISVDSVENPSDAPMEREHKEYRNSEVFFLNKPDASQTMVYAYIPTDTLPDLVSRAKAKFLNSYFGDGMSSIMFQEIREFRSMAYMAASDIYLPEWKNRGQQGSFFLAGLGTQCDKAIEAMQVLDSLLNYIPIRSKTISDKKTEFYNNLCSELPGFREKASFAEVYALNGLNGNSNAVEMTSIISEMTEDEFATFAKEYISGKPIIWCVVGNSKEMDISGLNRFGKVTVLKGSDVIR